MTTPTLTLAAEEALLAIAFGTQWPDLKEPGTVAAELRRLKLIALVSAGERAQATDAGAILASYIREKRGREKTYPDNFVARAQVVAQEMHQEALARIDADPTLVPERPSYVPQDSPRWAFVTDGLGREVGAWVVVGQQGDWIEHVRMWAGEGAHPHCWAPERSLACNWRNREGEHPRTLAAAEQCAALLRGEIGWGHQGTLNKPTVESGGNEVAAGVDTAEVLRGERMPGVSASPATRHQAPTTSAELAEDEFLPYGNDVLPRCKMGVVDGCLVVYAGDGSDGHICSRWDARALLENTAEDTQPLGWPRARDYYLKHCKEEKDGEKANETDQRVTPSPRTVQPKDEVRPSGLHGQHLAQPDAIGAHVLEVSPPTGQEVTPPADGPNPDEWCAGCGVALGADDGDRCVDCIEEPTPPADGPDEIDEDIQAEVERLYSAGASVGIDLREPADGPAKVFGRELKWDDYHEHWAINLGPLRVSLGELGKVEIEVHGFSDRPEEFLCLTLSALLSLVPPEQVVGAMSESLKLEITRIVWPNTIGSQEVRLKEVIDQRDLLETQLMVGRKNASNAAKDLDEALSREQEALARADGWKHKADGLEKALEQRHADYVAQMRRAEKAEKEELRQRDEHAACLEQMNASNERAEKAEAKEEALLIEAREHSQRAEQAERERDEARGLVRDMQNIMRKFRDMIDAS